MAGTGTVRLSAHRPGAADRGAGPARAQGGRRHRPRVQRAAPARRLAGHRPDHPPGRRADRRGRRAARDLRAGARLPRRQDRRLPRARRARRRAVADHDPGHRRAGQDGRAGVRPAAGVPPARGQPRGDPGADGAVPGRDRSPLRVALPGHRPPGLPARGQRGHHRPLPRPHRVRAHQADGPGHRRHGRPRGPRLRAGRGHGRQLRAAQRGTRRRGGGQGPARTRPGPVRGRRAGHVPDRLRQAEADRPAHLHLPARRRHREEE